MKQANELIFNDAGLIPAIVQDAQSKEVLTLAYMNQESYEKTLETGETWFFSRSRNELWHKGATSGHTQRVTSIRYDCDQDALLVLVTPRGPACHTGSYSCFSEDGVKQPRGEQDRFAILNELEQVIAKRQMEMPEGAYTTYLFEKGVDKILKKVGEEASEVIIAAKNRDQEELKWETADLLYHLLVLLREQQLPLDDVLKVLKKRHQGE
ncbi:bifunctional phosphoribosyl-AMP cyclohydrolase/phosphoribosyl-ATP diphosphatase HisIE [Bacillus altitudinis]|uniref:bifunctional phosphoribosyl-AMP cyclohydrolase/phosphoribosyl-ATP diphosphatase HisIE n=1 Tax=Bacillus altitudinis TaxID=293387 RepID=UPI00203B7D8C|nr:bifunctional phosphoribosyl-AMP cyclohydrolase/phosphoribosyl-ATP diphosphatase HisIE [Bacillus altitudinis]MCM3043553.1 bifunctional phosphoribosyl-AMP cyclohydrolase/phosphoribosyl-ATP diphosphatase HisIE [Bacillus altitudinis]MEC1803244.1 bifunctional phosphoribosyl-AMP cyclohydrolase/phosphoribosyl-ATP diphosphatase HisIE [Bacillus altitudinis]